MSSRERWIVYPLLFLALWTSLKSKLTRTLIVDEIRCRTLIAEERPGQSGSSDEAGNRVIVGHTDAKSGKKIVGVFLVDRKGIITPVGTVMEKGP